MKTYLLLLLCSITAISYAQNTRGTGTLSNDFSLKKNGTKGHVYLLNDWSEGIIVESNGNQKTVALLNFDIFNNQLTFKSHKTDTNAKVFSTAAHNGFSISDEHGKNFEFIKIEGSKFLKSKKETGFYQSLLSENTIIVEHRKKLNDPNASGWSSSSTTTKSAEYQTYENTYALNKQGKYVKVQQSQGSVLKALKDKKKELANYIKQEHLNIKKTSDFISLVNYYHSL